MKEKCLTVMKNHKNSIIIAAASVVLFCVLAQNSSQKAQGQGPPADRGPGPQPVTVVNASSEPVPIQGDVEVVNVEPLSVQGDVKVVNTEPVPVIVTNQTAFQPWQASFSLDLADGETSKMVSFPTIPAGKRLVIESITAQLLVLKEQIPYIQLMTDGGYHYVALSNIGSYTEGQYVWMATHDLRLYAESNGVVRTLRAGGNTGVFFASLSLSGYLMDLP
ncbi:MAG: hypothetical protein ACYTDV_03425 [Planctomycetota bacterium]|jgi:hypothetical protein